jgi:hypothetical protein
MNCADCGAVNPAGAKYCTQCGTALAVQCPSCGVDVAPAARAVANAEPYIERVDRLVQNVAARKGMRSAALDEIVATVDARIDANRRAAVQ